MVKASHHRSATLKEVLLIGLTHDIDCLLRSLLKRGKLQSVGAGKLFFITNRNVKFLMLEFCNRSKQNSDFLMRKSFPSSKSYRRGDTKRVVAITASGKPEQRLLNQDRTLKTKFGNENKMKESMQIEIYETIRSSNWGHLDSFQEIEITIKMSPTWRLDGFPNFIFFPRISILKRVFDD